MEKKLPIYLLPKKIFENIHKWLCLIMLFIVSFANAATFTSLTSGNWNNPLTWLVTSGTDADGIPDADDDVVISVNHIITLNSDATCTSIAFPNNLTTITNSELILAGYKLDVSGDISIPRANGTRLNILNVGTSILNVGGKIEFVTTGGGVRHKIIISTGTINVTGSVTCSNSAGTSPIIEFTANGFLNVKGDFFSTGTASLTANSGTINLNGANQSLGGFAYNNLVLSGTGTKTFLGATAIGGNLSVATGVIANLGTGFSHTANSMTLGAANTASGTWGGLTSSATYKNSNYFATNTGIITVGTGCTTQPSITTQPVAPAATCSGSGIRTLSVVASGTGLTYQWRRNGINLSNGTIITGVNTATLTLTNPTTSEAGSYDVVVTNLCLPETISSSVTVTINTLPGTPIVGTITGATCALSTGSVALSNLPSGNWSITTTPATVTTTGTGTTTTISGLAPNTYKFIVTNSTTTCTSLSSNDAVVPGLVTNTYSSGWSNGTPSINQNLVFAGNYTSSGGGSGNLNGCSCTVNAGIKVIIAGGDTLSITNAVTVNAAAGTELIFESSASLIQDTNATVNNNAGSITYKRISMPMVNFDYTYWSSPVSGQTLFNLSPNTLNDKYFSYSGTGWQTILNGAATMQPGIGYIIRTPKAGVWPAPYSEIVVFPYSQPVQFKGVPNNGNYSGQVVEAGKFYLIGNPYPSALDAETFLYTNINNRTILQGTIYLWTHNTAIAPSGSKYVYTSDDYASYNATGGTGTTRKSISSGINNAVPSGKIAAGQSFFGSAKAPGTIQFTNSMRVSANNTQFFKPVKTSGSASLEKHRLWLNMTNSLGVFKQTLIGYIEGASNSYDDSFDGISFDGNSFIDFYSINAARNLVIQGRKLPFDEEDIILLGYRSTIEGEFTIEIDHADGDLSVQKIYLQDKETGTISELTAGNYTFKTKSGTFNNRFVLKYSNKTLGTGDFETEENEIFVIAQNKIILINSVKQNIDKVFIFDLSGRQLYKKEKVNNLQLTMQNLPFAQQVLLIKIVLENGYETTKKVIFK